VPARSRSRPTPRHRAAGQAEGGRGRALQHKSFVLTRQSRRSIRRSRQGQDQADLHVGALADRGRRGRGDHPLERRRRHEGRDVTATVPDHSSNPDDAAVPLGGPELKPSGATGLVASAGPSLFVAIPAGLTSKQAGSLAAGADDRSGRPTRGQPELPARVRARRRHDHLLRLRTSRRSTRSVSGGTGFAGGAFGASPWPNGSGGRFCRVTPQAVSPV
jgi:hypothetical protein